jgi:ABC-type sugar transport system permease subunit
VWNTVVFSLWSMAMQICIGLGFALLDNQRFRGAGAKGIHI